MAASNEIVVKFRPEGDKKLIGAIKALANAQKKLTQEVKKQDDAVGKTNSRWSLFGRRNSRNQKSNSKLAGTFSVLRSKILLANFAMGMGIKQMFGFAKQGAKLQDVTRAFNTLSGATENSQNAFRNLDVAVNGTMSQAELFTQANNAMILGVSKNSAEMAEMFDVAQRLGRALGKDTAHSVESLITGIGRQSRLMLDNIGIIVKAEEAYEAFAAANGTTVEALTDTEKKLAFNQAAMKAARIAVAKLGAESLSATDHFNQFNSGIANLAATVGQKALGTITPFLKSMSEWMRQMGETDLETSIRQLQEVGASMEVIVKLQAIKDLKTAYEEFPGITEKIAATIGTANENIGKHLTAQQRMALGATNFQKLVSKNSILAGGSLKQFGASVAEMTDEAMEALKPEMVLAELVKLEKQGDLLGKQYDAGLITPEEFSEATDAIVLQSDALRLLYADVQRLEYFRQVMNGTLKTGTDLQNNNNDVTKKAVAVSKEKQSAMDAIIALQKQVALDNTNALTIGEQIFGQDQKQLQLDQLKIQRKYAIAAVNDEIFALEQKKIGATDAEIEQLQELIRLKQIELGLTGMLFDSKQGNIEQDTSVLSNLSEIAGSYKQVTDSIMQGVAAYESRMTAEIEAGRTSELESTKGIKNEKARKDAEANINEKYDKKRTDLMKKMKASKVAAAISNVAVAAIQTMADPTIIPTWMKVPLIAAQIGAGYQQVKNIQAQEFEQGGLIGGMRHSQGGTPIIAERGEFIMSREAVNAVGVESMNRINEGLAGEPVTINFSGNVMSQDFIENDAIPRIKEAVRRGADIGVS